MSSGFIVDKYACFDDVIMIKVVSDMKEVYEVARNSISMYFRSERENRSGWWNNIVRNTGAMFKFNIKWKTQINKEGFRGNQS